MDYKVFYKRFIEQFQIEEDEFKKIVFDILPIKNIKNINKLIEYTYDYITQDEIKFKKEELKELEKIYTNSYDFFKNQLKQYIDMLATNDSYIYSYKDMYNKTENLDIPNNPIEALSLILYPKSLLYLEYKNNLERLDIIKEYSINDSNKVLSGLLLEKLNSYDSLVKKGNKIVIQADKWFSFAKNLFSNIDINIPNSFDLYVYDEKKEHNFYEMKNLFIENEDKVLKYFDEKRKDRIKEQLQFLSITNSNGYFYMTNTKNIEKFIIPLNDLYNFIKNKNEIKYSELKEFAKNNFPDNYKEKLEKEKIIINPKFEEFFNITIHFFQRNLDFELLPILLNSNNNEDFANKVDNFILENINSKKELFDLFKLKNQRFFKDNNCDFTFINDMFNNFFDNLDFENKEMKILTYNNFKNCINNTFDLKGRNKVYLDKMAGFETYYRNKKFLDVFKKKKIDINILSKEKFLNKFLRKLADAINIDEVKKNLPNGMNGKDYIYRIKLYQSPENIKEKNLNL